MLITFFASFLGFFTPAQVPDYRFETDRAWIFPVSEKHAKILHSRLFSDPKVMSSFSEGVSFPYSKSIKRIQTHAKRWKENYPFSGFIAISKETRKLVGYVICGNCLNENCCELAYLIPKHLWGQGWGSEIVEAIVEKHLTYCYEEKKKVLSGPHFEPLEFKGVIATARKDNPASWKILEKAGFSLIENKEKYGSLRGVYFLYFEKI